MKKIRVLGCGWLGFPLAQALIKNNYLVKGSTTSPNKLDNLKENHIQSFLISLDEDKIYGDVIHFLKDANTLIINIPPKLRSDNKENFVAKINNIVPFIQQSNIENVLFVSSTSVYSDSEAILEINEDSIAIPESESGKQLLEVENLLLNNTSFKTTILRFGGLIGKDRHPVKFLAGRENIENPNGPVNLIHQDDCINIILKILETNSWNTIFNAVAPFHPSRKEYYTQKAIDLGLELPHFTDSKLSIGKLISSVNIQTHLNYTFLKKI